MPCKVKIVESYNHFLKASRHSARAIKSVCYVAHQNAFWDLT